jgi:hypothetical protein
MACTRAAVPRYKAFVEIFIRGRVVMMPPGIGVSPAGCSYPVRTRAPTGIVEVAGERTLGDFLAIWGWRPSRAMRAYVGSERHRGRLADIPLRPHAVVTLEEGEYVEPHANFVFPP